MPRNGYTPCTNKQHIIQKTLKDNKNNNLHILLFHIFATEKRLLGNSSTRILHLVSENLLTFVTENSGTITIHRW
jgi:hypothetical protein